MNLGAARNRPLRACTAVALVAVCSAGSLACTAPSSLPSHEPHDGALTLTIENDVFTGSDSNYTNGIALGWSTDDVATYGEGSFVRGWADFWDFLPFVLDDGYATYASWTLGQEMHAPDDITDPNPPLTDQPYAGVLYLDSILVSRGYRWEHRWDLRLGVVGPASQADDTQEWCPRPTHHRRGSATSASRMRRPSRRSSLPRSRTCGRP
jgi:hypothetical protein